MKSTKKDYWRGSSGVCIAQVFTWHAPQDSLRWWAVSRMIWTQSRAIFLGGRMVIACHCYHYLLYPVLFAGMNMKLPAVRLRFTRVLTWWHRRRRVAMLGSRRTVVGYLRRSGRCPLVLDPDTYGQSQRSQEQKTNDDMGRIVEHCWTISLYLVPRRAVVFSDWVPRWTKCMMQQCKVWVSCEGSFLKPKPTYFWTHSKLSPVYCMQLYAATCVQTIINVFEVVDNPHKTS